MSQDPQETITLERPRLSGFAWWSCEHDAFLSLCNMALQEFDQATDGVKQSDRVNRSTATNRILAAIVAQGRHGLAVQIAEREHRVSSKPITKFPKGHKLALLMLQDLGLVEQTIRPNPHGDQVLAQRNYPFMAWPRLKPRNGKPDGAAGGYSLTEFAWDFLDAYSFNPASVTPAPERLLTVKVDGERIAPPVHSHREKWRNQLIAYNKRLGEHTYTLDGTEMSASALMMRRTWNDPEYTHGGRFYCSFVSEKSQVRKTLTIDGTRVLSFDYAGLHARLSLSIIGTHCPGDQDPRKKGSLSRFTLRDVKAVWNAALNVNNKSGYTSVLKTPGRDKSEAHETTLAIIQAIKKEYPGIETEFGCGLKLQHADALAVDSFMKAFTEAKFPIVFCHDGLYIHPDDFEILEGAKADAQAAVYRDLRMHWPEVIENPLPLPQDKG